MRILSADAMRAVDRTAIEEIGIPSLVLMENAAIGVADAIADAFPDAVSAVVVCGPGNNGGDGLAVARQLDARGYRVQAIVAAAKPPSGDCAIQLEICRRLRLPLEELPPEEALEAVRQAVSRHDLLVDALFGTGLTRALEGGYARLVELLDELPLPKVAVDLPSGLDASSPRPPGPHLTADLTVALAAPKIAHVLLPAAAAAGTVVVADLGFSPDLVERAEGDLHLSSARELASALAPRAREAHKGDFGHLLIVAGSEGKSGAAMLAARGALRCGCGLVTVAVPGALLPALEAASLESMSLPLPQTGAGALGEEAFEALRRASEGKDALALGPGLGLDPTTQATIRRLVGESEAPLVLDADGVNAFAGRAGELTGRRGPTVLTPHPAELARLLGTGKEELLADRPAAARRAAEETGAVVVMKGYLSLVADPLGGVAVNPTGNPGMATGGTGDVLTGAIGALLAQGYDAVLAAQLGVFLHGAAGDLAAERQGETAMSAGDLLESLPAAWRQLSRG